MRTDPMMRLLPRALHETDRPSATAQWVTLSRALELGREPDERIVTDRYAPTFLAGPERRVLGPLQAAGGLVRAVERTRLASIGTSALCRHRFLDAHLLEELPDTDQVLILGAGYDSRAYRFARAIGHRPVIEVDLAPLSRAKRQIVDAHPEVFGHGSAISVEIDFRTQSLPDQLAGSGFVTGARTYVIWEGVSMYLTRAAVTDTLRVLAEICGTGSMVAMDYWQHVGGLRPYDQLRRLAVRSLGLIGEPVGFAIDALDVGRLLDDAGFGIVDLATADTMTARYATGGRHCDEGMYVVAARLG